MLLLVGTGLGLLGFGTVRVGVGLRRCVSLRFIGFELLLLVGFCGALVRLGLAASVALSLGCCSCPLTFGASGCALLLRPAASSPSPCASRLPTLFPFGWAALSASISLRRWLGACLALAASSLLLGFRFVLCFALLLLRLRPGPSPSRAAAAFRLRPGLLARPAASSSAWAFSASRCCCFSASAWAFSASAAAASRLRPGPSQPRAAAASQLRPGPSPPRAAAAFRLRPGPSPPRAAAVSWLRPGPSPLALLLLLGFGLGLLSLALLLLLGLGLGLLRLALLLLGFGFCLGGFALVLLPCSLGAASEGGRLGGSPCAATGTASRPESTIAIVVSDNKFARGDCHTWNSISARRLHRSPAVTKVPTFVRASALRRICYARPAYGRRQSAVSRVRNCRSCSQPRYPSSGRSAQTNQVSTFAPRLFSQIPAVRAVK